MDIFLTLSQGHFRLNTCDSKSDSVEGHILLDKFRHKIHVFTVEVSNRRQLHTAIGINIGTSIWKNHMALLIILDRSPRCASGAYCVTVAWYRDAISATVLCYARGVDGIIVNSSPFTSQTPARGFCGCWTCRKRSSY